MACARDEVLDALGRLAPLELSESWDNTGVLVAPDSRGDFVRAFLTIDLTAATLDEADELAADLIVSYHPPIFAGLKRLRRGAPGEDLLVRAICAGQTIYSPHTALDAVPGGMNDWLASALGPGEVRPLVPSLTDPQAGAGRFVRLNQSVSLEEAIARIKSHLGLPHVRIARSRRAQPIETLVVCPGAGGSLFEKVQHADLFLTGEMRHHDVLARTERESHVILTDHTNTERAFLPEFARRLQAACPGLEVSVSRVDSDPLSVA